LLNLPAATAMRSRCAQARDAMQRAFRTQFAADRPEPFRILTVPCGIPRDVRDFASRLATGRPEMLSRVEYTGMDIDPDVVGAAKLFLDDSELVAPRLIQGNALDPACFAADTYHFIASTGLGEFLDDEDLQGFYGHVFDALAPGGVFFTSATVREPMSDAMLRMFELDSHYRSRPELERLLAVGRWRTVTFDLHPSGLQIFVRATKP
jgi:SAM-dependent methyltransferase